MTVNKTLSIGTHLNGIYSVLAGTNFCKSYEVITELNDEEISREDITADVLAAKEQYGAEYVKEYELEPEDTLTIYVEAEDTLGYLHKVCVLYWQREDVNGASPEKIDYGMEYIYDKSGELLVEGIY